MAWASFLGETRGSTLIGSRFRARQDARYRDLVLEQAFDIYETIASLLCTVMTKKSFASLLHYRYQPDASARG
jgi:hypothetical protein